MSLARRSRRLWIRASVVAALCAVFATIAACSNGGEGDRCQAENNASDCQDGLICLPASQKAFNVSSGLVNYPYNTSDRCCPQDRSTATHPACVVQTASLVADSAVPPSDTGPTTDAAKDSTAPVTDAASDAAQDAADAGADADAN
jgi:hypothetical protein